MNWRGVARARWRLAHNSIFRRGRGAGGRIQPLWILPIGVVLGGVVCLSFAGLFGVLAAEGSSAAETAVALAWMLTATLVGLLVFDLQEAVSTIVADSDLDLLRRAPISPRMLFLLKLADAFPRTSLLLAILVIPAVIAYHYLYPLPVWMLILFPLQMLALWAIPLGLGTVVAIHLLRFVPVRRARATLGLLSTFTLFSLWMLNSFLIPHLAAQHANSVAGIRELLATEGPAQRISPGHWAAGALAGAATGSASEAARGMALVVGAALLALAAAGWTAARHLEEVQMKIAARGSSRRGGQGASENVLARPAAAGADRSQPLVAVAIRRDARLLLRDWTAVGDVLTTAVLWTLLPLVGMPLFAATPPELARAMLLALTVGLGFEVASRAVPFEGKGWAWMRLAPVPASRWVMSKWTGTALFAAPLVTLAAISIAWSLSIPAKQMVEIVCLVVPALMLALAAGLWTGIVFGRSDWINPRNMLTVGGRITATFLMVGQALTWFALSALADLQRDFLPPGSLLWTPAAIAALLVLVPLRASARRLDRREWR